MESSYITHLFKTFWAPIAAFAGLGVLLWSFGVRGLFLSGSTADGIFLWWVAIPLLYAYFKKRRNHREPN